MRRILLLLGSAPLAEADRKARAAGAAQGGVAEGIGSQHANANLAFGAVD